MSSGYVLPAGTAACLTFNQLCLAAAQVSADCCGIELASTDTADGAVVTLSIPSSLDVPAELRRSFRLPDELPDVLVATAKLSLLHCSGGSKGRVIGLDCPTLPAFTESVARWVRACQAFCASAAFTGEAAQAAARFQQMLGRADGLHGANPYLVGTTLTVVDIAVSVLVVGTAAAIDGTAPDRATLWRFRGPFFHHCRDVLGSIRRSSADGTPSLLCSRSACPTSIAIVRHLHQQQQQQQQVFDSTGVRAKAAGDAPFPPAPTPAAATKQTMNGLQASVYVAGLAMLFFLMTGMESGTGPSALKTMKADLRTSTIGITAALQMKEIGKIIVAPVGHFTVGPLRTKLAVSVAACLVWGAGMIIIGTSPTVIGVGAGSLIGGLGFGVIFVIYSPLIVSLLPRAGMHVLPSYTASIFASAAFGVVVAYGIAGATLNAWRLNFALSPVLLAVPAAIFVVGLLRIAQATKDAAIAGASRKDGQSRGDRASDDEPTEMCSVVLIEAQNYGSALPNAATDANTTPPPHTSDPAAAPVTNPTSPEHPASGPDAYTVIVPPSAGVGSKSVVAATEGHMTYMAIVRMLLRHPFILWTIVVHCGQTFCIASFATLLPLYIQERMGVSQGTASYVMAGTVPFLVAGTIVGGVWSRRRHYGLVSQLNMTRIFSFIATCMMPVFLINSLLPFVIVLLAVMFIISLKAGPQTALLSNACMYIAVCHVQQRAVAAAPKSIPTTGSGEHNAQTKRAAKEQRKVALRTDVEKLDALLLELVENDDEDDDTVGPKGSTRLNKNGNEESGLSSKQRLLLTDDARHLADRYISAVSSIVTVAIRIFGTIPGPIILSVLVDQSGWAIQYPFLLVGLASCGVMTGGAFLAYCLCPEDADEVMAQFHVECVDREMQEIFGSGI